MVLLHRNHIPFGYCSCALFLDGWPKSPALTGSRQRQTLRLVDASHGSGRLISATKNLCSTAPQPLAIGLNLSLQS
jgi:hypothetical protein